MKFRSILLLLVHLLMLCFCAHGVVAQSSLGLMEVKKKVRMLSDTTFTLDSSTIHILDSIEVSCNRRTDSLMFDYESNIRKIDSLRFSLRREFDSLRNENLFNRGIAEDLDSLSKVHVDLTSQLDIKL